MDLGKNTVIVILIVALLAVGAYVYTNTYAKQTQTISVQGDSEISVNPDMVSVYLNIETLDKSADISKNTNSDITKKVMLALKSLNIADEDIETMSYNIYPDYSWESEKQVLKGYKTSNQIKIKLEDYKLVGSLIDKTVDAGALVSYINFELSPEKENQLKAQAIEKATLDAKNKAEAVARGSGGKLGKLISVSTNNYYYRPYMAYDNSGFAASSIEMKSAAVSISPQNLKVIANVQAVYRIA